MSNTMLYKYIHYGKKGIILSKKLYNMGYRTRKDLLNHIIDGKLPKLPSISQIYIKYNPVKRISYAMSIKIINFITKKSPFKIIPVGSIRRKEKINSDIDLLLVVKNKSLLSGVNLSKFLPLIFVEGSDRHQKYIYQLSGKNYLIDIFLCTGVELPYMLFHYTGNKIYNIRTRAYAKKKGWLLNQYGLFSRQTKKSVVRAKTEKDLIKFIGVSYKKPEMRKK